MFAAGKVPPIVTVQIETPANYLILDCETCDAPAEALERQMDNWKPPSNYRDQEKIEAKRREDFEKIMERGALLDASPVICIGVKTDTAQMVFHQFGIALQVGGWVVHSSDGEKEMLILFRNWLNQHTDISTVIVCHNRGFDIPKLRHAYLRHRLKLPEILAIRQRMEDSAQVVDTAQLFKAFSMQYRNDFCPSLSDMADSLGMIQPKGVISGADVPRMHKEGKFQEICMYCAIDVSTTEQAYLLMTGQSGDLK